MNSPDVQRIAEKHMNAYSNAPYISTLIRITNINKVDYLETEPQKDDVTKYAVSMTVYKNGNVYFGANEDSSELTTRGLEMSLWKARKSFIETNIHLLPEDRRNLPIPERVHIAPRQTLDDWFEDGWEVDANILEDLSKASAGYTWYKPDVREAVAEASAKLYLGRVIFMDSKGTYIEQDNNMFGVGLELHLDLTRSFNRRVRFAIEKESQQKRIYELIKYMPDLTEHQIIRESTDFENLMDNLHIIAMDTDANYTKVKAGRVNVITDTTFVQHETMQHLLETPMFDKRTDLDDPLFQLDTYYGNGEQIGPQNFNLTDNPRHKLPNGLKTYPYFKYDMEGFESRPIKLVSNGTVRNRRLGSRYSAGKETGRAFTGLPLGLPTPRMTCGITEPSKGGASSLDELIEMGQRCKDKRGKNIPLVVCIFERAEVDPRGLARFGWDGEYQYPETYLVTPKGNLRAIKTPILLNTSAHLAWQNVNIARNWSLTASSGQCGKGSLSQLDYWDFFPNPEIGPLALFKDFKLETQRRIKSLP